MADLPAAASDGRLEVRDPATGAVIDRVVTLGTTEVGALVETARAAQPAWRALGFAKRAAVMREVRGWLASNLDLLLETLTAESGSVREDALFGECFYVCESLGYWARHARRHLAVRRVRTRSPIAIGRDIRVHYWPRGVVGVIAPWNFPLALGFGDAVPALMAGNAVVIKPSSQTPLSTLLVERAWREVGGPAGLFGVAVGGAGTGSALIDAVDMVMFTGSVETGRAVAERAARRLIPASLELGGKDPMLVLADADLDRAAATATQFAFWHSGQICMSVERVYVEDSVHDDFVQRVVARTRALRQRASGPPGSGEVGAMVTVEQLELVEAHIADAVEKGAHILAGGRRGPGAGTFHEPTVLVDVDHTMRCMTEETFGPLLPIMRVADEAEALRLANDSPYGLNSSVFTRDLARGQRIAAALEAGNTCVNDAVVNAGIQAAPFGSMKDSGLGTRNGEEGIRKYCSTHTILVTRRRLPGAGLFDWPNDPRTTRLVERAMRLAWGVRRR